MHIKHAPRVGGPLGMLLVVCLVTSGLRAQETAPGYMEVWPFILTDRTFKLRIPAADPTSKELMLRVRILPDDGSDVRTADVQAIWRETKWPLEAWRGAGMPEGREPRGAWIAQFPLKPTPPGRYQMTAEVIAPTRLAGRRFRDQEVIVHPEPEWLHSRAGIEGLQSLPEPWTPMQVDDTGAAPILSCWNRRTVLSAQDGLVDQIQSGNKRLLAAPMRLRLADARGVALSPDSDWRVLRKSDIELAVTRVYSCEGSRVVVSLTQEYDGFTWFRIDLESERPGGPG